MPTSPSPILTGSPEHVNATPTDLAPLPVIDRVCGVDFSGAAKSGKTAWLAECEVSLPPGHRPANPEPGGLREAEASKASVLRLRGLSSLGRLAGSDDRQAVCEYLVSRILESDRTLWAMDFPFALPLELGGSSWGAQLDRLQQFASPSDTQNVAVSFGRSLASQATRSPTKGRLRRQTDVEMSTPFDSYHYRIIYQTFHGMRDVLRPIASDDATAVLPFQYSKLGSARRLVVESCPASFLKRAGLPATKYKQTAGRAPSEMHQRRRSMILRGLRPEHPSGDSEHASRNVTVHHTNYRRRQMMRDSGGDAIDAVLAAAAGWRALFCIDHMRIARHARYPCEGFVYV